VSKCLFLNDLAKQDSVQHIDYPYEKAKKAALIRAGNVAQSFLGLLKMH